MDLRTAEDVELLGEMLHDGWIDLDGELQPDPAGTVVVEGWVETDQVVVRRRLGPIVLVRAVTARFRLVLEHVSAIVVRDGSETGGVSVSTVAYDAEAGTLTIQGNNDCDLAMTIGTLAGEVSVDLSESGVSTNSTVMLRRSLPPAEGR